MKPYMRNAIPLSLAALMAVAIIVIGGFYPVSPERMTAGEQCFFGGRNTNSTAGVVPGGNYHGSPECRCYYRRWIDGWM
jgi:hypothetical protein